MASVQFNQIPGNIRVPFIRFEVNAGAAPYQSVSRLLLFGLMTTQGLATPNVPVWCTGNSDGLFGVGSMASAMYKNAAANGPFQEIWVVPLSEPAGSAKAVGNINLIAANFPLANSCTLIYYIGGLRVAVPVNTLMALADAQTAIIGAVNACPDIQVVATAGTAPGSIVLTANQAGTLGNTILVLTQVAIDDGPFADQNSTIVPLAGGSGDPDVSAGLAHLGDDQWDFICCPFTDTGNLDEIDTYLQDRWGPNSQKYGLHITAKAGTAGQILAFTILRNSPYTHIMAAYNIPNPIYLVASATACQAAVHLQSPPELSRPLQDLQLVGIRPPKLKGDAWNVVQRQGFYYSGASAYVVSNGEVFIDRLVSTYQRDNYGNNDASFLDINTLAQAMWGLRSINAYLAATYPRAALVDDNSNNLQGFATPQNVHDTIVHAYKNLELIGVFQNSATFEELLVVERNESDPNRLDSYLPFNGVNQLRILAVNATSYLQYPAADS